MNAQEIKELATSIREEADLLDAVTLLEYHNQNFLGSAPVVNREKGIYLRGISTKAGMITSALENPAVNASPDLKAQLDKAVAEIAALRQQRDALLEITWLDLPGEPVESIEVWRDRFAAGWSRKAKTSPAASS